MRNFVKNIISKPSVSITSVYIITFIFVILVFYPLIPLLLNYPPGTVDTVFQQEVGKLVYSQQYLLIVSLAIIVGLIVLKVLLRGIDEWANIFSKDDLASVKRLKKIRQKCHNLPYAIYLTQIMVPTILSLIVLSLPFIGGKSTDVTPNKILIVFFSFFVLFAVVTHIFSRRIFARILISTYRGEEDRGVRIGLKNKIFLQLIPILLVALLFTSLVGYSRFIKEKGELLSQNYQIQLNAKVGEEIKDLSVDKIQQKISKIKFYDNNDASFIVTPKGDVFTSDNSKLSDFFIKYLRELSPQYGGRVFDFYTSDIQGVTIKIRDSGGDWIIGVKYNVASKQIISYLVISFIVLLCINILVLSYFSKSLAEDISNVAKGLSEIAESKDIENIKPLPVTSLDEIGDLVVAFNKIQEITRENIRNIKESNSIMMEQERLASLGQLVGGIAHNLKTPIMSIAGGAEALIDLAKEIEEDTAAGTLEKQDYIEIAGEIKDWVLKIQGYQAYMSDVITAVKGQAVQLNASSNSSFTLDELVKRVDILMKHELKKYYCVMDMDVEADTCTELKGEINTLVQILNNLISNAIQAYDEQGGKIDFVVSRKDKFIEFVIKDYGKGIPEDVKDKLFKEMITTKGKNGTGLGLYMSYSTIKGRFGGNMKFESEEGKGTTFYITIPYISQGVKKEVS